MGYTSYWDPISTPIAIPKKALNLCREVIDYGHEHGVICLESDDNSPPIVSSKMIRFNGIGENGHETFWWENKAGFNFCKTARKPYDLYVCAILLILRFYINLPISSDGDEEWIEPIQFLLNKRLKGNWVLEEDFRDWLELASTQVERIFKHYKGE